MVNYTDLTEGKLFLKCMQDFTPPETYIPLLGSPAVLIGLSFSANKKDDPDHKPGRSNQETAAHLYHSWETFRKRGKKIVVIAQREVAEALREYPFVTVDKVIEEARPGKHISTHEVLGQAWRFAQSKDVTQAIIHAHYRHALRATWNAALWGFDAYDAHEHTRAYAPESTQWHTRNPLFYFIWEIGARIKLVLFDRPH